MQPFTVQQVSAKTGIPARTLQHRIKAGTVQADKIGDGRTNAYLIPSEEVDRLVAEAEAER
jgi:predicted thioesterase